MDDMTIARRRTRLPRARTGWRRARRCWRRRRRSRGPGTNWRRRGGRCPGCGSTSSYGFETEAGPRTLAELFDGRSQLLVYHFMFGPDWEEGCKSCSYVADHIDGALPHLAARDVTLTVVSRAPLAKLLPFKARMGWRFPWVSSFGGAFNTDFGVSFDADELAAGPVDYNYARTAFPATEAPGMSAFIRGANGEVFHTYSAYARGLDMLVGAYNWLDLAPKGRDEDDLPYTMSWVRHHDR